MKRNDIKQEKYAKFMKEYGMSFASARYVIDKQEKDPNFK